jgi:hypothetical protein
MRHGGTAARRHGGTAARRHGGTAAFAAPRSSTATGQLGRSADCIDEHQAFRFKIGHCAALRLPPAANVGPLLFAGMRGFFKSWRGRRAGARPCLAPLRAMGLPEIVGQFGGREVGVLGQDHGLIRVRFEAMGAMVAAP